MQRDNIDMIKRLFEEGRRRFYTEGKIVSVTLVGRGFRDYRRSIARVMIQDDTGRITVNVESDWPRLSDLNVGDTVIVEEAIFKSHEDSLELDVVNEPYIHSSIFKKAPLVKIGEIRADMSCLSISGRVVSDAPLGAAFGEVPRSRRVVEDETGRITLIVWSGRYFPEIGKLVVVENVYPRIENGKAVLTDDSYTRVDGVP